MGWSVTFHMSHRQHGRLATCRDKTPLCSPMSGQQDRDCWQVGAARKCFEFLETDLHFTESLSNDPGRDKIVSLHFMSISYN